MELSFVAITPRSLAASRTGGIIARLLMEPRLEFVSARMYAPSDAFVDDFLKVMPKLKVSEQFRQPYRDYIDFDLRAGNEKTRGYPNHLFVLFFRGKNALSVVKELVGPHGQQPSGANLRGTFGEYTVTPDGVVHDFHPGVLTAFSPEVNKALLKLLAKYADTDGGVLAQKEAKKKGIETTLVMIKPDNLDHPSTLPGHIIDRFGCTGLQIVGTRLFSMSVEMGMGFYGFLEEIFVDKLSFLVELKLHEQLALAFDFEIEDSEFEQMVDVLKKKNAHTELAKIVHYMTGIHPDSVSGKARKEPGPAKCFALLFQGQGAIDKIRDALGATDPNKAAFATVRGDYGHDLMHNGAHASDSVKSATRERKIVGLTGKEKSAEKKMIETWLRTGKV